MQWTSQDLGRLPDNGKRYEIIEGELYISKQQHWYHQFVANQVWEVLQRWSRQTKSGVANAQRDRNIKLKLYSRRGVLEYWIVDWQERSVEVYRREEAMLKHISTLYENDILQ